MYLCLFVYFTCFMFVQRPYYDCPWCAKNVDNFVSLYLIVNVVSLIIASVSNCCLYWPWTLYIFISDFHSSTYT